MVRVYCNRKTKYELPLLHETWLGTGLLQVEGEALLGSHFPPHSQLGNTPNSQDVKAGVANTDRLVQFKFDDRNLLGGTLMAEQTPTVPAARNKEGKRCV